MGTGDKGKGSILKNVRLKTKFAGLVIVLIIVSLAVNVAWSSATQRSQMEDELREKGQVLAQQMSAVWDFMSANQERLAAAAYTEEGVYQGLHCAIVGRSIGQLFTMESDYITRFVNFNPRNAADVPDGFEAAALTAFNEDRSLKEYYAVQTVDGEEVFRYLAPMKIEENCLECHGSPKGEIDQTGFPKEGWSIGDIGGAISITIPMDLYREGEVENVVNDLLFFASMLVVFVLVMYIALSHLVTKPLSKIQAGVEQVRTGDLDIELAPTESSREMGAIVKKFNDMTQELSNIYENLEEQVEDRTAQLARANEVLERQRAQLEEANERLKSDNQYKSDFLAMMSHELRTPLTSILAFAELLNKDSAPASEKEAETRREIEANSRALLFMINDILEMSRLDAGRIELALETVDLGDVAGLVQSVTQPIATHNDIDLVCEVAPDVPLVTADFEKLRHVTENLVGNAIKFTPTGGRVRLAVSYDAPARQVVIEVSDTGIGIAEKDQQRIFERFVQADSSESRRFGGTGLGLSLAKEYTEMHHGTITVESELGRGSTFTVRIPVEQDESETGDDDNS